MEDNVLLDPSGLQLGQHAERRGAALELVLAGLQVSRGAAGYRQEDEACAAPDPAGLVEATGYPQNPIVRGNLNHHRSALERVGGSQDLPPPEGNQAARNEPEAGEAGT